MWEDGLPILWALEEWLEEADLWEVRGSVGGEGPIVTDTVSVQAPGMQHVPGELQGHMDPD